MIIAVAFALGLDMNWPIGLYVNTQEEGHDYRITEAWFDLALRKLFLIVCWGSTCWHTTLSMLSLPEAQRAPGFQVGQETCEALSFESVSTLDFGSPV